MWLFDVINLKKIKEQNLILKKELEFSKKQLQDFGFNEYTESKKAIDLMSVEISSLEKTLTNLNVEKTKLVTDYDKVSKNLKTQENKIAKSKELVIAINYSIDNFFTKNIDFNDCIIKKEDLNYLDELVPSVILKINSMNVSDLRKAYNANNKQIESLLDRYKDRYTTKANKTIYALMVIALRAELQNILVELKYEKLDKAIELVRNVTNKYLIIATDGNQSIAGTITKFIGEIEYLFINAVKIEYNYYVKKEQAKQEQLAIREQMRQEAEERKAIELERKKIEKEEEKYSIEIEKITEKLTNSSDNEEVANLKTRLLELECQLADVVVKKEEVVRLQNGKAGTVYVISNLGSFGENIFKVGMTRRLEPQDRVNELGDASVPFKFDVHSFIFSEDAVSLENNLHKRLNEKRLNKVNRRKEFFKTNIEELETLVLEVQPTAEFNKTMIADEFRQSLSTEEVYNSDFVHDM